ncbi:MAG: ACP S-malonyltransferase [Firmicutes bacterium]|nr:ACP S-malonyltransferase [Bacillota bacterium]
MKKAILFPGQGAQASGMGKALYESSFVAQEVFDKLEAIRSGTIKQCFEGSKEELSQTINTQPCIFAVSMANAMATVGEFTELPIVAGFSLGEVVALTFAGVMSLEDGFRTVVERAKLMNEATSEVKGTMSAVLRLETEVIERLASENGVYTVNYNCPGQVVVSGEVDNMAKFNEAVNSAGGRAMPLAVSGAFHSPYMKSASDKFRKFLDTIEISPPKMSVYSNVTAKPYPNDIEKIKDLFASQISSPVLWEQTVRDVIASGAMEFIEMEPGKVLTGLVAKIKS